jgi:hypothetical protein
MSPWPASWRTPAKREKGQDSTGIAERQMAAARVAKKRNRAEASRACQAREALAGKVGTVFGWGTGTGLFQISILNPPDGMVAV